VDRVNETEGGCTVLRLIENTSNQVTIEEDYDVLRHVVVRGVFGCIGSTP
jgi:hypothetical protein